MRPSASQLIHTLAGRPLAHARAAGRLPSEGLQALQDAAALVAASLKLGTSLVSGLVMEEARPGACTACAASLAASQADTTRACRADSAAGSMRGAAGSTSAAACTAAAAAGPTSAAACMAAAAAAPVPPLPADAVLADVSGDGEVCWERTACLVAHQPGVVAGGLWARLQGTAAATAGSGGGGGGGGDACASYDTASVLPNAGQGLKRAPDTACTLGGVGRPGQAPLAKWVAQLLDVEAGRGRGDRSVFGEVVAQSVGLRLLLSMLRARTS